MTICEDLLDRLDVEGPTDLPDELAAHALECDSCGQALARVQSLAEAGHAVRGVRAPSELVGRLKEMRRLPLACEQALEQICIALDGELPTESRAVLVGHFHACPACQAAWDALATLRETGKATPVSPRLRARLALHPRNRIELRRRSGFFDLRLATAAAYLVAAMTIMLLGNPASIARASSAGVEKAQFYTRAAVENRLESLTRRARTAVLSAQDWLGERAGSAWNEARRLVRPRSENPAPGADVVKRRDGGKQS